MIQHGSRIRATENVSLCFESFTFVVLADDRGRVRITENLVLVQWDNGHICPLLDQVKYEITA